MLAWDLLMRRLSRSMALILELERVTPPQRRPVAKECVWRHHDNLVALSRPVAGAIQHVRAEALRRARLEI